MSARTALLVPGRHYPPTSPLLVFAREAVVQHGFAVRSLWWDASSMTDAEAQAPDGWVRRQVEAEVAAEGREPALVVAKSLGTRAASYAAERALPAIWFTPLLHDPAVADAIAANEARQLLVGGLADDAWDADVAAGLARGGCDVLEIPDADHAMLTGDAVRSAKVQYAVAEATELFLRSLA